MKEDFFGYHLLMRSFLHRLNGYLRRNQSRERMIRLLAVTYVCLPRRWAALNWWLCLDCWSSFAVSLLRRRLILDEDDGIYRCMGNNVRSYIAPKYTTGIKAKQNAHKITAERLT
jgi:hypothetical protein